MADSALSVLQPNNVVEQRITISQESQQTTQEQAATSGAPQPTTPATTPATPATPATTGVNEVPVGAPVQMKHHTTVGDRRRKRKNKIRARRDVFRTSDGASVFEFNKEIATPTYSKCVKVQGSDTAIPFDALPPLAREVCWVDERRRRRREARNGGDEVISDNEEEEEEEEEVCAEGNEQGADAEEPTLEETVTNLLTESRNFASLMESITDAPGAEITEVGTSLQGELAALVEQDSEQLSQQQLDDVLGVLERLNNLLIKS